MAERPTGAFVLTLLGGILQLILGIVVAAGWYKFGTGWDVPFAAYWIALAAATMLGAFMIYSKPSSTRTWGTIIIILSIISGINLLTLIGGILARRWVATGAARPSVGAPPPPPPPPPSQTMVCPSCGGPLRYIEQYKRWYCDKEQKYV